MNKLRPLQMQFFSDLTQRLGNFLARGQLGQTCQTIDLSGGHLIFLSRPNNLYITFFNNTTKTLSLFIDTFNYSCPPPPLCLHKLSQNCSLFLPSSFLGFSASVLATSCEALGSNPTWPILNREGFFFRKYLRLTPSAPERRLPHSQS